MYAHIPELGTPTSCNIDCHIGVTFTMHAYLMYDLLGKSDKKTSVKCPMGT